MNDREQQLEKSLMKHMAENEELRGQIRGLTHVLNHFTTGVEAGRKILKLESTE